MRKFFYNSITISLPKNIIQFFLGVVLFWLIFGAFNPITAILALLGFVITYSSIYMFNDIIDAKEDAKDPDKKKWKLIASGDLSIEGAMSVFILLIISGMFISIMVSPLFATLMLLLLFLNFLHSSTYIHLKKSMYKTSVNLTAIEFIKYSCGWFALTASLVSFPFWLVLMLSVAYTISYIVYKFKFTGSMIRKHKSLFAPLGLVCIASYILAFVIYDFPLALLIMFLGSGIIIGLSKKSSINLKSINNMVFVEYMILPLIIISFLVISLPFVASANDDLTVVIQEQKENAEKVFNNITSFEETGKKTSLEELLFFFPKFIRQFFQFLPNIIPNIPSR